MAGLIAFVVSTSIFFVSGVILTFWTERLRSYWIRQADKHPDSLCWRIIGCRVRSQWYSVELRLYGLLRLGTALFFTWAFARQWLYG